MGRNVGRKESETHLLLLLTTRLSAHFSVSPNDASEFTSLPINQTAVGPSGPVGHDHICI